MSVALRFPESGAAAAVSPILTHSEVTTNLPIFGLILGRPAILIYNPNAIPAREKRKKNNEISRPKDQTDTF